MSFTLANSGTSISFMDIKPAHKLFNEVIQQDINYINDAVKDKIAENYYLDFKQTEKEDYTGRRSLYDSDRKNLAKSISAFGNSEGGVMLWGIKTGKDDMDYASVKAPIKNVSNFLSLLESFVSTLTVPTHPTVSNKIIFENKSDDIGYIVTHIPKSSQRPFQVVNEKDFRYYIRAGSSSLPAPDNFLRSLFGQEPQPNVFITFAISTAKLYEGGIVRMDVGILLYNGGENVSKNINGYVHVGGLGMAIEINKHFVDSFSYYQNPTSGMKVGFVAKQDFILGVEQEVQPLIMHITLQKPITENGIMIKVLVNGTNQASHRWEKIIEKEKLEEMYDKYIKDQNYDIVKEILKKDDEE